jgi:hypothetical protein
LLLDRFAEEGIHLFLHRLDADHLLPFELGKSEEPCIEKCLTTIRRIERLVILVILHHPFHPAGDAVRSLVAIQSDGYLTRCALLPERDQILTGIGSEHLAQEPCDGGIELKLGGEGAAATEGDKDRVGEIECAVVAHVHGAVEIGGFDKPVAVDLPEKRPGRLRWSLCGKCAGAEEQEKRSEKSYHREFSVVRKSDVRS